MSTTITAEDLTCPICLDYYNDPLTLTCGHSFCRTCLLQSTRGPPDRRGGCPNCRKTIEIKKPLGHPADAGLERRVDEHFRSADADAAEIDHRATRAIRDKEILDGLAEEAANTLPVYYFFGAKDSPGSSIELLFKEPRYRMLIRRAWEGNKKFICLRRSRGPREGDVGLLVRVEAAIFSRSGKAQIRGKGIERVTLGECWQEPGTGGLWYSKVGTGADGSSAATTAPETDAADATTTEDATAPADRNTERRTSSSSLASSAAMSMIGSSTAERPPSRAPAVANGKNLGWLPVYFYNGLQASVNGTATASFELFEESYKELAREVMEKHASDRFFLCCDSSVGSNIYGVPAIGSKATLVVMEGCEWSSNNERVKIIVKGIKTIKIAKTRMDPDRGNLWYVKQRKEKGVARFFPSLRPKTTATKHAPTWLSV